MPSSSSMPSFSSLRRSAAKMARPILARSALEITGSASGWASGWASGSAWRGGMRRRIRDKGFEENKRRGNAEEDKGFDLRFV